MNSNLHTEVDVLFWQIALKDDKEAFKELFVNFFAPLCVYAQRFIDDRNTCEDVVQEVFFRIWKNRKSLEIKSSTRNYLITNVKNSCIDYLRRKDVEQTYIMTQTDKLSENEHSDELYTVKELEETINKSLTKLPDKIREVFEMSRFEGLTYAEIAAEKNISVKTVEAYMTRALKILRVELKDYLPFVILFLW